MSGTKDKVCTEKLEKPAKRWVNWWRCSIQMFVVAQCDRFVSAGDVFSGSRIHHSIADAEQDARESLDEDIAVCGRPRAEYLGAYPEGERP